MHVFYVLYNYSCSLGLFDETLNFELGNLHTHSATLKFKVKSCFPAERSHCMITIPVGHIRAALKSKTSL